jgi:hypothetical protein
MSTSARTRAGFFTPSVPQSLNPFAFTSPQSLAPSPCDINHGQHKFPAFWCVTP